MRKTSRAASALASLVAAAVTMTAARANDMAVETAAGGLRLRHERSILMEQERLFIRDDLVRVEYVFRNVTKKPVTSEVAFPIPRFPYDGVTPSGGRDFADFRAWVDGRPIALKREIKAFVGTRDVTGELRSRTSS